MTTDTEPYRIYSASILYEDFVVLQLDIMASLNCDILDAFGDKNYNLDLLERKGGVYEIYRWIIAVSSAISLIFPIYFMILIMKKSKYSLSTLVTTPGIDTALCA